MFALMLFRLPVLWLLKLLVVTISSQHLQRLCPQGMFPVLVGGPGVSSLDRTSRSLRFLGRLNATSGGLGMACLSLAEVWRIGRCFLVIFARLDRVGWYVTTSGVLSSGGFGGRGCRVSCRGMLAALWI